MKDNLVLYRDIFDEGLITFCINNLSPYAKIVLGVFIDTDGKVKVDQKQYAYLVQLYLEVGSQTNGEFNGILDFDVGTHPTTNSETDTLM